MEGSAAGEVMACFGLETDPDAQWLAISAVPIAAGLDPDVYLDATAGVLGGEPFPTPGLDNARGVLVSADGGQVTANVVLVEAGQLFSILLVHAGDPAAVTDLALGVATRQRDHAAALAPAPDPGAEPGGPSGDASRLDRLLLAPEPGSGLMVLTTGDAGADVDGMRPEARSQRVVDLVDDTPTRLRILATDDGVPAAVIVLAEEPYDVFAATALGILGDLPAGERFESPHLDAVPDGIGFRSGEGSVGVGFRRGRYSVLVVVMPGAGDDDTAAQALATLAGAQADLLPEGATSPYTFPSTTEAVLVAAALTTAVAAGALALGRLAAARQRRRTDPPAGPPWTRLPPGVTDMTGRARSLRRRGLVLVAGELVAVNAVVIGTLGATDVLRLPAAVTLGLLAGGLAGGIGFSAWWARSERRDVAGDDPGGEFTPSPAAAAGGLGALALLVAGTALVGMGIAGLAFGPSLRDMELARRFGTEPRWVAAAYLVVGSIVLVVAGSAVRLARMWARADGARLRSRDRRPPILYLRSFEDDALGVATVVSARRPFLELFTTRGTDPFEESLTWQIRPYGPVVAVGRPGRPLASLGAARDHLPDAVWQPEVAQRMAQARAIVVVIGATEGLRWELTQLVVRGHLARTVFVLPPSPADASRHRWAVSAGALAAAGAPVGLLPVPPERALVAVLLPAGTWWVAVADHHDEAAYRAALDEAMLRVTGARPPTGMPPPVPPPPLVRR